MSYIVGIHYGHDASISLLHKERGVVGVIEKERISRKKHDSGEINDIFEMLIKGFDISINDIEIVSMSLPIEKNQDSGFKIKNLVKYTSFNEITSCQILIKGKCLPLYVVPHHICHSAYSYFTSSYGSSAVISWDGGGDYYTEDGYTSTLLSHWKDNELINAERVTNCDIGSLWFIYSRAIFGDGNASGKLMGLSAYGTNELVSRFRNTYIVPGSGEFADIEIIRNTWSEYYKPQYSRPGMSWEDKLSKDIAYAIQYITNEIGLNIANKVFKKYKSPNLCLSGGVALNGYLNEILTTQSRFNNIHIPPCVHDGGISTGAALFTASIHNWDVRSNKELVFLGNEYVLSNLLLPKPVTLDRNEAEKYAAMDIVRGHVVAWYEGRAEFGPRALGHRSFLASATYKGIRDRINLQIKGREPYRPLAPVVRESDLSTFFDTNIASPYMMRIVKIKEKWKEVLSEVNHIDNTARVQTVTSGSLNNILTHLESFGEIPIIINTSLNTQAPIVDNPMEAVEVFKQSSIEAIFIDGYGYVRK